MVRNGLLVLVGIVAMTATRAQAAPAQSWHAGAAVGTGDSCAPGDAAELRLHLTKREVAPGEMSCAHGELVDAAGCAWLQHTPIKLALSGSDAHVLLREDCVVVQSGAAPGTVMLTASASDLTTSTPIQITSQASAAPEPEATDQVTLAKWMMGLGLIGMLIALGFGFRRGRRVFSLRPPGPDSEPAAPRSDHVRSCPICLAEYPHVRSFCVKDGAELVEGTFIGGQAQGMLCPTCRRGYPTDASFCPEDSDELVPYGLFASHSALTEPVAQSTSKICPQCGNHYATQHLFCGHDGSELVSLN